MRTAAFRTLKRTMDTSRPPKLEELSKEDLIARIHALESLIPAHTLQHNRRPRIEPLPFNFAAHPSRKVALKFTYAGWDYNGLAAQSQPTPLPTVEQVLFDALVSTRLIDPEGGMDGCGWSRCGRTDRGVSAASQVVSLRLRSALGDKPVLQPAVSERPAAPEDLVDSIYTDGEDLGLPLGLASPSSSRSSSPVPNSAPKSELAYVHILNRVLPPTIRILAWSPVSDTFDARFSCQYRHYKYFFTRSGRSNPGGLDTAAMRDAACRLVGEHDFRNFCKLDPSKQIENFSRRVLGAWIERVESDQAADPPSSDSTDEAGEEDVWVFNLKGTAFLWHQVRCIMAILFLVGARLEPPSIIDSLLHTSFSSSKSSTPFDPVESKPNYAMADGLPLVLWDCGYRLEDVQWQTDDNVECKDGILSDRERTRNFWFQLYALWTRDRIQTTMQSYFLRAAEVFYPPPTSEDSLAFATTIPGSRVDAPVRLNMGGGVYRHTTRYIPILEIERGEKAEAANLKWREGAAGKRRLAKRGAKKERAEQEDE
ncbi:tRNA pseudouridine synthase [Ceratobasidium sp. AG-I]|nr:tRNA pseudouridine synthase [Ceratobasidium sp. AG-I]